VIELVKIKVLQLFQKCYPKHEITGVTESCIIARDSENNECIFVVREKGVVDTNVRGQASNQAMIMVQ
jgi:hypothetical protein